MGLCFLITISFSWELWLAQWLPTLQDIQMPALCWCSERVWPSPSQGPGLHFQKGVPVSRRAGAEDVSMPELHVSCQLCVDCIVWWQLSAPDRFHTGRLQSPSHLLFLLDCVWLMESIQVLQLTDLGLNPSSTTSQMCEPGKLFNYLTSLHSFLTCRCSQSPSIVMKVILNNSPPLLRDEGGTLKDTQWEWWAHL